jgi:hypothetical protein
MWIYIFDYNGATEINTTLFTDFHTCVRRALQLGRIFDTPEHICEVSDTIYRQCVFNSPCIKIFILKLTTEKSEML